MSDFIEEMEIEILQNNIIKRNIAIEALQIALKELKKGKKELNHMAVDPCHIEKDSIVHEDYNCIIREISSLIKNMVGGDWCFSVNNTVGREEEIDKEIEENENEVI